MEELKYVEVKHNYKFVKLFNLDLRKIYGESNIKNSSLGLLIRLSSYLDYPENNIKINGETPSIDTLLKIFKYKRSSLYDELKDLEESDLIARRKIKGKSIIFINPFVIISGSKISINTYEIFKNSIYNTEINPQFCESIIANKICYANDGTKCLSSSECIIHNFLLRLQEKSGNMVIEKEVMYKKFIENSLLKEISGSMRCDWIIGINNKKYIIEYFGLMDKEDYRKKHDKKIEIIKLDNKFGNFIPLYESDLLNLNENLVNKLS